MEEKLIDIILNPDGTLIKCTEVGGIPFDFNAMYLGYYPVCSFTAAVRGRVGFYLAGLDSRERAHLLFSPSGTNWTEKVLASRSNPQLPEVCGAIVTILEPPAQGYTLLVCRNGWLITLPGCPKCIKECHYSEEFVGANVCGDHLELHCRSGAIIPILPAALSQIRTSWSYALPALRSGALLLDLRSGEDGEAELPYAVHETVQGALLRVKRLPPDAPLFLFCYTGAQADTVAELARYIGHTNTFSLGGKEHLLETNGNLWPGK